MYNTALCTCYVTSKAVARQGYNLDFAQHTHRLTTHTHTHTHTQFFEQPIKFCVAANLKSFKNLVFQIIWYFKKY